MKAIGGYFELECGTTPPYYPDGIYLNLCRSGIRYLIRSLGIKKLHVPLFTCHVVNDSIRQEGCEVIPYHLDDKLLPAAEFHPSDFIIYNNYFGVLGENVRQLAARYPNLIVDNAQAFYSSPDCRAAVYSPRKFFGLPDGGVAFTPVCNEIELEQGTSFDRCSHLLKRIDLGATEGYEDFQTNDGALDNVPLMAMSPLTNAILSGVNYEDVKHRRRRNFEILHQALTTSNRLAIPDMSGFECPMVYPYWCDDPALRKRLIADNIFVATYWPNVLEWCAPGTLEQDLTLNLLPLPIDQRYGVADMKKIIDRITK